MFFIYKKNKDFLTGNFTELRPVITWVQSFKKKPGVGRSLWKFIISWNPTLKTCLLVCVWYIYMLMMHHAYVDQQFLVYIK